jgi:anti-sigma factor RsiW
MRCNQTEKLLSRSFDDRLTSGEQRKLEAHIESCPRCRALADEYRVMLGVLRSETSPETPSHFWQRLQPRIEETAASGWLPLGKQLGLRAIPLVLLMIAVLASAAIFFLPAQPVEISQAGALLRNQNPLEDTLPLLSADSADNPNMTLIFTTIDNGNPQRRFP